MLTKKQANWLYAMFFNGVLKVPRGQPAGFAYDYVGGGKDERLSRFLANVFRIAKGGAVERANMLMDSVFAIY